MANEARPDVLGAYFFVEAVFLPLHSFWSNAMRELSPDQIQRLHDLAKEKTLDSQLPWKFANGAEIETLFGHCPKCGAQLSGESLRGRLQAFNGRLVVLDAVSICKPCGSFQGVAYRFRDDMSIEGMSEKGWSRWESHPHGFKNCARKAARVVRAGLGWLFTMSR